MNHSPSRFVIIPTQEAEDRGRVILRDGSVADVRPAIPADQQALTDFFRHLSPEARMQRFFTASLPSEMLIAGMCRNGDPDLMF